MGVIVVVNGVIEFQKGGCLVFIGFITCCWRLFLFARKVLVNEGGFGKFDGHFIYGSKFSMSAETERY